MRIKIRDELDINAPINLRKLSPTQKVIAGLQTMWRNTEFYKKGRDQRLESANIALIQKDEKLKDLILGQLYTELINNKTLGERDEKCKSVILAIDYKYCKSLYRILEHKDFLQFNVEIVKENSDIRKAFSDMPLLVKFSMKVVGGD